MSRYLMISYVQHIPQENTNRVQFPRELVELDRFFWSPSSIISPQATQLLQGLSQGHATQQFLILRKWDITLSIAQMLGGPLKLHCFQLMGKFWIFESCRLTPWPFVKKFTGKDFWNHGKTPEKPMAHTWFAGLKLSIKGEKKKKWYRVFCLLNPKLKRIHPQSLTYCNPWK